jgi:hypothetical protein
LRVTVIEIVSVKIRKQSHNVFIYNFVLRLFKWLRTHLFAFSVVRSVMRVTLARWLEFTRVKFELEFQFENVSCGSFELTRKVCELSSSLPQLARTQDSFIFDKCIFSLGKGDSRLFFLIQIGLLSTKFDPLKTNVVASNDLNLI